MNLFLEAAGSRPGQTRLVETETETENRKLEREHHPRNYRLFPTACCLLPTAEKRGHPKKSGRYRGKENTDYCSESRVTVCSPVWRFFTLSQ